MLHNVGDHSGVLQSILNEVEVEALPADLPHQIDVDASSLTSVGDSIYVRDLPALANIRIVTGEDELIASLVAEAVEAAEEAEEGEAAEGEESTDATSAEGDSGAASEE